MLPGEGCSAWRQGSEERVYQLAVEKFDLLIGNYHQLRHAAIPTTGGKRDAIICYSSVLVDGVWSSYEIRRPKSG